MIEGNYEAEFMSSSFFYSLFFLVIVIGRTRKETIVSTHLDHKTFTVYSRDL